MGLKVLDLVPDEFYRIEFDGEYGRMRELVFQHKDSEGTDRYPQDKDRPNTHAYVVKEIDNDGHKEFKRNSTPFITGRKCRPATILEKKWLQECMSQNKYVEKPSIIHFEDLIKEKNKMDWYVNIVGLEDTSDDRLMSNFTSDFEFIGFSRINGGPIFKLKENGQTEKYWQENVMSKINEIGGMVNMISHLPDHITEEQMPR